MEAGGPLLAAHAGQRLGVRPAGPVAVAAELGVGRLADHHHRTDLRRVAPLGRLERDWAFGDGLGAGVRVAIVDSGVEGDHPAVGGAMTRSVRV